MEWLGRNNVSDEAREMIYRQAQYLSIRPDKVLGTEVFIAVDDSFSLVDVPNPGLGKSPKGAFAHGTLDLVEVECGTVTITDYKSGWATKVDPYEAVHYATLMFALYPNAESVKFRWWFVRAGAPKEEMFVRYDIPRLQSIVRAKVAERNAIESSYRDGESMEANPLAGLCSYCGLECPLRAAAMAGNLINGPIQNEDDARTAAGKLVSIRAATGALESQLKDYLDKAPAFKAGGFEVGIKTSMRIEVPLGMGLAALGMEVDTGGRGDYDIDPDCLRIGVTELKRLGKAKKRAGMLEAIDAVAEKKPWSELSIKAGSE